MQYNVIIEPLYNGIQLYINGLVQDCSNSIANALELLQSCPKPSIEDKLFIIAIQAWFT